MNTRRKNPRDKAREENAVKQAAAAAKKHPQRSYGVILPSGREFVYQPSKAKHPGRGQGSGKGVDRALPRGTVVRVDGRKESQYFPREALILLPGGPRRPRGDLHEKGHYLWDRRLSKAQRAEFARLVWSEARRVTGRSKKEIVAQHKREGRRYSAEEEMFAIFYAGHKEKRRFARGVKGFFDRLFGS